MKLFFLSQSPKETRDLASIFVSSFFHTGGPVILALSGDLGSGKTTFVQGLAKSLGIKERVLSPSFVIMKPFSISSHSLFAKSYHRLWHIDCWRLKQADFEYLGLKELLKDRENIVCLEWAEKAKKLLPKKTLWLKFEHDGRNKRKIILMNSSN